MLQILHESLFVIYAKMQEYSFKPSCHIRFPHAFFALRCVFEEITFFPKTSTNQRKFLENAPQCGRGMRKREVATQLYPRPSNFIPEESFLTIYPSLVRSFYCVEHKFNSMTFFSIHLLAVSLFALLRRKVSTLDS